MEKIRLNKFIAESGFCSRRKADKLIEEGRVKINNKVASLGDPVLETDKVKIDNNLIKRTGKKDVIIAFHKPVGVICSLDPKAKDTILDYVHVGERIFNIGRLDVASSGLLLLTNNGDISEAITHPKGDKEKEYVVTVDKKITRSFLNKMTSGILIEGKVTKPARIKRESDTRFHLILTEGRNRQIRKMCEALGYEVKKLKRIRIMNVRLGDLGAGNWRHLTKKERRNLLESL